VGFRSVTRVDDPARDVVNHYEAIREEDRLERGAGRIELVRTQEILRRHLPAPPARVLDVGGGSGAHSAWLLDDGYDVHLIDPVARHVELARRRLGGRGLAAEIGDARRLPVDDAGADAALLLGPLYHLVERADRLRALGEACRSIRPGGVVAVAAISRFASLFDGLARGWLFEPEFADIVRGDLADGRHVNPTGRPEWFTTAYFHRPDELAAEITDAGLDLVELLGVEGLAGWLGGLDERWADDAARAALVESARLVEAEPALLGVSPHLLAIARRPTEHGIVDP
jgi:ubiquinone/menaquinone biosynthesis C-methylase UbiE